MQPIQDVVEQLVERNLTVKATLGLTQIGRTVFRELFFGQFDGYAAHGGTLSGSGDPDVRLPPSWAQSRRLSTAYEP